MHSEDDNSKAERYIRHRQREHKYTCLRKQVFENILEANQQALKYNKELSPRRFEAYYCFSCGFYHVGGINMAKFLKFTGGMVYE